MRPLYRNSSLFCALLTLMLASACSSSDDGGTPPQTVDCSASGPSITLTATATDCGEDNGSIAITVNGGTGTLDVTLDPQPLDFNFANNTFTDLEPGTYDIEVTDADNCATMESAVVGITGGGVSYMDDVDPIVQAKCAIDGCHVAGNPQGLPDYTVFTNVQARANNEPGGIRQRVKTGDMPRTGSLEATEIAAILCWIDEGAQDN